MEPDVQRPTPQPDADTAEFWAATLKGRLHIQRCRSCQRYVHYPRVACPWCMSRDLDFEDMSGRGVIYSYTTVHRAPAAFAGEVPYVVVLVDLDEGVRLLSRLVGLAPDAVAVGMPVQVTFHPLSDEAALPFFEPQPSGGVCALGYASVGHGGAQVLARRDEHGSAADGPGRGEGPAVDPLVREHMRPTASGSGGAPARHGHEELSA